MESSFRRSEPGPLNRILFPVAALLIIGLSPDVALANYVFIPPTFNNLLIAFLITLPIEMVVFLAFVWRWVPIGRAILVGALATCITYPVLGSYMFKPRDFGDLLIAEFLVILAESVIYFALARPISFGRAFLASFFANTLSVFLPILFGRIAYDLFS